MTKISECPHEGADGGTRIVHLGSDIKCCIYLGVQYGSQCITLPILKKIKLKNVVS